MAWMLHRRGQGMRSPVFAAVAIPSISTFRTIPSSACSVDTMRQESMSMSS
jgi:hypothetical protein